MRAYVVWTGALLVYTVSVMQRTTFGVAGMAAVDRFEAPPALLSAFVFLQVAVYLALQVPAGLLLDRFGSRALLCVGSLVMAVGQGALALAVELPQAFLARTVVGAGDALIFVAALAIIPRWFAARTVPLLTQLTAMTGQVGQILSALPFLAVLNLFGWFSAFGSAALMGILAALLSWIVVRNAPADHWRPQPATSAREVLGILKVVWLRPGTRLGFFSHMGTQFSGIVFSLMWGVPYLLQGQQLSVNQASALMTVFVLCSMAVGPVMGVLAARHPLRRSWLVLTVIAATATTWTVVLLQPEPAPMWLVVVLVVVLAAGPPGSVVGFDFARTSNPSVNFGIAQSLVNLGGFLATLTVLQVMGMVMSVAGGYTFEGFRVAWLVQYPVWAFATVCLLVARRKTRRVMLQEGVAPRPLREVFSRRRG